MVSALPASPPQLPPRYELRELLGRGGMGEVYAAFDHQEGRLVAIKRLRTQSADDRLRLEREAQHLSRVRHEGIVRLHDIGTTASETFLAMEYVEGVPLSILLREPSPSRDEAFWILSIAVLLVDALSHLHDQGLLHRDLKPSNVMVISEGSHVDEAAALQAALALPPRIKLLDFGLAVDRSGATPQAGGSGTPLYMSPEQLEGKRSLDERSDLYSLGALIYHCLTRRPPYSRLADALSRRVHPEPLDHLSSHCPEGTSALVASLLEKEPHRRPDSALETRDRLLSLLDQTHKTQLDRPRLRGPMFVGRTQELASLREHLRGATTRTRAPCIRLTGARGAGKTWLLEESGFLGEALAEHGLEPIRAHCSTTDLARQGATLLLEELLSRIDTASDTKPVPSDAETWLAAARQFAKDDTQPVSREQVVTATQNLIRWYTEQRPLLIVFDAFEKADEFTMDVVANLTSGAPGFRGAVVVSYRSETTHDGALAVWAKQADAAGHPPPIAIGYLTDEELTILAERMLRPRRELSSRLRDTLLERSEGSPLVLSRWLQALWEHGAVAEQDHQWTLVSAAEPDGKAIDLSWRARCAALPAFERKVLGAATVCGEAIQAGFLAAVLGLEGTAEEEQIPTALRTLASRAFLLPGSEGYELPPDLRTSTIADLFDEALLATWNRRVAMGLQKAYGPQHRSHLFRVARHLADAGAAESAAETLVEASRYAAEHYANRQAISGYEHALRLAPGEALRLDALSERGELYRKTGEFPKALADFESALDLLTAVEDDARESTRREAALQERIGWVFVRQGKVDQALELFTRALASVDAFPELRALLLMRVGGILWQKGDTTAAREHFRESGALYAQLGDYSHVAEAESNLGLVEKREQSLDRAVEHFERARQYAERSNDLVALAGTLGNLGNLYRARGDDTRALEHLELCREARLRIGDRQGLAICLNNLAQVQSYRGKLSAAADTTREALHTFEQIGDPKGTLIASCNLATWLVPLGHFDEAQELLERERPRAKELGLPAIGAHVDWNTGLLLTAQGSYAEADRVLRNGLRELPGVKPSVLRVQLLCALAEVQLELDNLEIADDSLREAGDLLAELGVLESKADVVRLRARLLTRRGAPDDALAHCRPLLEESGWDALGVALLHCETGRAYRALGPDWADRTERHLHHSIRELERLAVPHRRAETQAELALYWLLCGEEDEARALLAEAAQSLVSIGAETRAQRLQELGKTQ